MEIFKKVLASETWTMTAKQRRKMAATEMGFLRKIENETII